MSATSSDADASEHAGEPKHDKNEEHEAENASQSGTAIAIVSVVTAAAEQQHKNNDYQQKTHGWIPLFAKG